MKDREEFLIWNVVAIYIVNVKHGLLLRRSKEELFENSMFLFVVGKKVKIYIEDIPYTVQSNGLFHIGRNKKIRLEAIEGEVEYYIVAYQAELLPNAGRELMAWVVQKKPFDNCEMVRVRNVTLVSETFIKITNLWSSTDALQKIRIKQLFYGMVYEYCNALQEMAETQVRVDVLEQAYTYMQKHFREGILIQELADVLGINRSTLYDMFQRNMGIGPQQFLMQLRLDAACLALKEDRMSMDEIAVSCGLRDKSYFSRIFKQKYGMPPGEYRKLHLKVEHTMTQRKAERKIEQQVLLAEKKEKPYILIENFGRIHRYYGVPRRIVCLDYSAAEICAAMGLEHRIVGMASAEGSLLDCASQYQKKLSEVPFLQGREEGANVPSLQAVCACKPDLVIGTAYSFRSQGGIADAEEFEKKGIHIYALKATYTLGCSFEDTYEDIQNLGCILGTQKEAIKIIEHMKQQEKVLQQRVEVVRNGKEAVRVFSFDGVIREKAFTCGQSLETHLIQSAGGQNIFDMYERQFVSVEWSEVAKANPQVIIVHQFHDINDGEQKIAFLKRVTEISNTDAVKNNRIYRIGIKKVFPGMDNVETAFQFLEWFDF